MDRFQTVNGGQGTMHPIGTVDLRPPDFGGTEGPAEAVPGPLAGAQGSYGTCLYFGPRGERCTRRALASGFCSRHRATGTAARAGAAQVSSVAQAEQDFEVQKKRFVKVVFSLLGFAAVLWPIIADAVRAILALLRGR